MFDLEYFIRNCDVYVSVQYLGDDHSSENDLHHLTCKTNTMLTEPNTRRFAS